MTMPKKQFFQFTDPFPTGSFVKNIRDVQGQVQAYRPELHPTDPTVNPGISGPPGAEINEVVNIPAGNVGEVVYSDDAETVVLFPIHSTDKLEPHLIKAQGFTSDFKQVTRKPAQNPFIWNRNRGLKDPGKPKQSSYFDEIDASSIFQEIEEALATNEQSKWKQSNSDIIENILKKYLRNLTTEEKILLAYEVYPPFEQDFEGIDITLPDSLVNDAFINHFLPANFDSSDYRHNLDRKQDIKNKWNVGEKDEQGRLKWKESIWKLAYTPKAYYEQDSGGFKA